VNRGLATAVSDSADRQLLTALNDQIEQALQQSLERLGDDCPPRLLDAIRYVLLAPGKRLRPLLACLAGHAVGGPARAVLPAAVAVEMIHCYSLVHDDLPAMDDDDLRRGRATCHKAFDEATAILVGDALQALAFEQLGRAECDPGRLGQACLWLAQAAGPEGLVGGQMDDLNSDQLPPGLESVERIHRRKTGAMIRVSVELGGLLAGGDQPQLDGLKQYGQSVGLAFQIVDDLLDVESTAEEMGKQVGKDRDHGKMTYPELFGIERSRQLARQAVEQAIRGLDAFDRSAEPLRELAKYLLTRSS